MSLHLISHHLCPYVQRAVISLTEKKVEFERTSIDLADKPDWFLGISPLGKTPVLIDEETPIFESAVILEYLEETQPKPLHPPTPLARARHRGWIEFGSSILNDIAGFYGAKDADSFTVKVEKLARKFNRLEATLGTGPYFDAEAFTLVDAVFGPVFRYFDVFDGINDFRIMTKTPKINAWRDRLAKRPSIIAAVSPDYSELLYEFLQARQSHLTEIMNAQNQRF